MNIAVVGADARALCRAAGIEAEVFPALALIPNRAWDLLALARDAAQTP